MLSITKIFVQKTNKRTEKRIRSLLERITKSKKKIVYKKFNKLIKKTKITVHDTLALNLLVKYKIVIYLFEKYITKNEE